VVPRLRGANGLTLGMTSANALVLGDARWKFARPICRNLKQFSTPCHFSGRTASPSPPQRRYPLRGLWRKPLGAQSLEKRMVIMEKKQRTQISALSEIPPNYFRDNMDIDSISFSGIAFDAFRFENSFLKSCAFSNCTFTGCIFDKVDFQRVDFSECNFSHCTFERNFRYITGVLENCELDSCDFSHALIQNTKWIKTILSNIEFRFIKAKSIDFSGSTFENVNFDGANLVRGFFNSVSGLERKIFYNTKLDDCMFDWQEAFIIMEFGNSHIDNLYTYGIEPVLKKLAIDPKRVDRYEFHGRITDEILQNIITCKFVIAECSESNKNVFFELGFALGHNKPIVFCVDKAENIPFDLKDYRFIIHDNSIDTLRQQLEERVKFMIDHDKDTN
jgi:fluoroquinolone resistance protein